MLDYHPLTHLNDTQWSVPGPSRIVTARYDGQKMCSFGNIQISEDNLLKALPYYSQDKLFSFNALYDGWKVTTLKSFRPLIYFCAFSDPVILDCVEIAVQSLITYGGWTYDIAVLTDETSANTLRQKLSIPEFSGTITIIPVSNTSDKLDWCLSRYDLSLSEVFKNASPILYLDADIVCDHPLHALLPQLATSPFIHVCPEGRLDEGSLESEGHWFGWRLLAGDNVPFEPFSSGFSSGALGFSGAESANTAFHLIRQAAYGWMKIFGGRDTLPSFDQRFANYVLRKMALANLDLMPDFINLYRIPHAGAPYPSVHARKGIVHFLGVPLAQKRDAMAAYYSALSQNLGRDD
ncbi:hypothetical protein AA106555_0577 [Neokomagataea thailandica NBRC 106555]|uniref:Glycosyl transferase n=2 Tax=Neokomagataea TaxID=1223423 RepID=A0A4Y6V952_9PROT|nr:MULTISPECIES: hypothetical protein [Neokomagataea]QDH25007.1 hypothetical protein D5366_07040 [Neokomagataea tanensis]GBR51515.1 hypothetical protein AA106555_0577 [Neokomagataea thailandica NBRC 106555]